MAQYRIASPLLFAILVLSHNGAVLNAQASATPTRTAPKAKELLQKAAANITKAKTLHFTLTTHSITPGSRLAAIVDGTGDVISPDRLVFKGSMQTTPALAMQIVSAMCGSDQYLELGDGEFQKMEDAPNVHRLLFAQDSGIVTGILTRLKAPSAVKASTLEKLATWQTTGTVPANLLAMLPGRTAATSTKTPVRVQLWIGQQDSQLHQMTITGPMFDGDSDKVVRTLAFSQFNEKLTLTVPRGHLDCITQ